MRKLKRVTATVLVAVTVLLQFSIVVFASDSGLGPDGLPEFGVLALLQKAYGYDFSKGAPLTVVLGGGTTGTAENAEVDDTISVRAMYTFLIQFDKPNNDLQTFAQFVYGLEDVKAKELSKEFITSALQGRLTTTLSNEVAGHSGTAEQAVKAVETLEEKLKLSLYTGKFTRKCTLSDDEYHVHNSSCRYTTSCERIFGHKENSYTCNGNKKDVLSQDDVQNFVQIHEVLCISWGGSNRPVDRSALIINSSGDIMPSDTKAEISELNAAISELSARGYWPVTKGSVGDTLTGFPEGIDPWSALISSTKDKTAAGGTILEMCKKCANDDKLTHLKEHSSDRYWQFLVKCLNRYGGDKKDALKGVLGGSSYYQAEFLKGIDIDTTAGDGYEAQLKELAEFFTGNGTESLEGMFKDLEKIYAALNNGLPVTFDTATGKFNATDTMLSQFENLYAGLVGTGFKQGLPLGTEDSAIRDSETENWKTNTLSIAWGTKDSYLNQFFTATADKKGETVFQMLRGVAGRMPNHDIDTCTICKNMDREVPGHGFFWHDKWWFLASEGGWSGKINYMKQLRGDVKHVASLAPDIAVNWQTNYPDELLWMRYLKDLAVGLEDAETETIKRFIELNNKYNGFAPSKEQDKEFREVSQKTLYYIFNSKYSKSDQAEEAAFSGVEFEGVDAVGQKAALGAIDPISLYSRAEYVDLMNSLGSGIARILGVEAAYSRLSTIKGNLQKIVSAANADPTIRDKAAQMLPNITEYLSSVDTSIVDSIVERCTASRCNRTDTVEEESNIPRRVCTVSDALEHYVKDHLGVAEDKPESKPESKPPAQENESSSTPYNPDDSASVDGRRYRPEIEFEEPQEKTINTPIGVANTEIAEAIEQQKTVNFFGSLTQLVFYIVGELLVFIAFFYSVLYVLTRTAAFFPRSILQKLSFNKLDAYDVSIPQFMGRSICVLVIGVLFVMGYAYDFATWVVAKLMMLFGLV